jgi:hypothetical protein
VLAFGQARAAFGLPVSLFVLAGFFGGGLLLLRLVNEREGIAAAAQAEADATHADRPRA